VYESSVIVIIKEWLGLVYIQNLQNRYSSIDMYIIHNLVLICALGEHTGHLLVCLKLCFKANWIILNDRKKENFKDG